ncbi:MAG: DNA polymerase III subunit alpha, partial [Venatoribacter sp.]
VSQIVTFGTMAAKAVVRDVARAQGKSFGLADKLSKLIPPDPGMSLNKALEAEPAINEFLASDEDAQEIWEMALKLEGLARQTGKHAGGVVIAPTVLTDFSATACDPGGANLVTQFDKSDVEEVGLVKFDFLGLRTLTIIKWALETINRKNAAKGLDLVDISRIPLDDAPSFTLLKSAQTTAVFQLESRGMKDLIRRLQPDNIEDMIALVALFRPGPLESGMVDDFINRKHGRAKVAYPHPDFEHECLKEILEPTYGVIVYQEQVMQIAQALSGYTLGGADMLRRAMGKKKPEEMAKQRDTFREGAISQGVDGELAMKIFDLVEKFAGYGFNKSHSAAYAIVSYQTLWLKQHYPAAFMAAVMTSEMTNIDKIVVFVEECREMKLELILPDVNQSVIEFTVNDDNAIVYGLGAVKGVGEGPIEAIIKAREEGGAFTDLFDFCKRVGNKVNKRVLEALVRSGAFDRLEYQASRSVLMASIEDAVKSAGQEAQNQAAGMMDLFGEIQAEEAVNANPYERYDDLRDWSLKERLQGEKDTLGLYVTGHPFDEYEQEVRALVPTKLVNLQENKNPQKLAGLVVDMRVMKNKRGEDMCFVTLDDRSGRMEVALFSDVYKDQVREVVSKDKVLVIEALVSHDDYSGGLKATSRSAIGIDQARLTFAKGIRVQVHSEKQLHNLVAELKANLEPFAQGCPVILDYQNSVARCDICLGDAWRVNPSDQQLQNLRYAFGADAVELKFG